MNETEPIVELEALAAYLKKRRDSILKTWREAVKRDLRLTNTSALSSAQFYDHIPDVLDAFERNLSAHEKPIISGRRTTRSPRGYDV